MAKQVIGIGSAANDGTGDPLRDAFDKCNDNFTELYDGKVEPDVAFSGDLIFTEAADHSSTPGAGFGYLWVKSDTPSSLIFTDDAGTDYDLTNTVSDVIDDTTPQLGGNLDVNGNAIVSVTNGDIAITPDGTGSVVLDGLNWPQADGTADQTLVTDGAGNLSFADAGGSGAFTAAADTTITPTTSIVLDEATGDEVALDLSYTVNKAAGNDTGLLINQTDTASPGTSLLADFQVGGTSKFSLDNTGAITLTPNGSTSTALIDGGGTAGFGLFSDAYAFITGNNGANNRLALALGNMYVYSGASGPHLEVKAGNTQLHDGADFGWTSGNADSDLDTILARDAANTLALRNSTNAQAFNVYNTYTDASNYERGFIKWNSNVLEIGAEAAGTGTQYRVIRLVNEGGPRVELGSNYIRFTDAVTDLRVYQNDLYPQGGGGDLGTPSNKWDWVNLDKGVSILSGYTVATLPTASTGMIARVTDADTPAVGSTVTGGGAAAALCWYNGSSWSVIGI